jgi:hypothetical protein
MSKRATIHSTNENSRIRNFTPPLYTAATAQTDMMTACSIPIGSPPTADFKTPKEEELDDAWSTRAAETEQTDLGPAATEEGEFKPDLYLLLDGILPSTIEDWETELQKAGPIINDLFIGHVTKVRLRQSTLPVKEEPRSVVFVGPVEGGGSLDSYGAAVVDTNAQQQNPRTLYHPYPQHIVSNQPHHLEPSHGPRTTFSTATGTIASIATTSLSPHHLHSTFPHDNASFSISPLYSLQSTSIRQPAREPISVFDDTLHFAEIRQQRNDSFSRTFEPGHYPLASHQPHHHEGVHIPGQEPVFDPPGMESCSLENEDESAAALWQGIDNVQLFVMSSPSASSPSDYSSPDSSSPSSSPSSSSRSQEEILEEIQRECAEIEERYSSVSPPASQSPSTSRVRAPHSSKSRHNQSHSGTPTLQGPIKRSPRSSRSTNSASPFATSDRTKELNRMAAIKYRERRRQERESATGELTQLEARNRELLADYASVEAEIKYLKRLIAEINARTASSS